MTKRRGLLVFAIVLVAAVTVCRVADATEGTIITLADGVVVPPGPAFVDLNPLDVEGFDHVALLGFTTGGVVSMAVTFSTDPLPFSDAAPRVLVPCGGIDAHRVDCGGVGKYFFPVVGQFLVIRLNGGASSATSVTLKAFLTPKRRDHD